MQRNIFHKYNLVLILCLGIQGLVFSQEAFDSTEMMIPCIQFEDQIVYHSSDLIEDKLSCIENEIPYTYNKYTWGFINYFTVRKRSYVKTMQERKGLYFPMFEKKLAENNLPDELKYLSIIESGLNPRAQSFAGAAGLWQFISSTGKMMGLKIDHHFDERLDPEKSTDAACRYLKNLHNTFGDWRYAIAAYNCGPGNVRKAKRKSGYKKEFWEVYPYLPKETRGYVPQFMAIAYAMEYAEDYNLFADTLEYLPATESFMISEYCNLDTLCEMLDYCFDDLIKVNGSVKRHYLPENSYYYLNLPADLEEKFMINNCEIMDSCKAKSSDNMNYMVRKSTKTTQGKNKLTYKVKSGDYLGKIAQRYHVSVTNLRKWNGIQGNTIRVGQKLSIWTSSKYVSKATTTTSAKKPNPLKIVADSNSKLYIVQPGDTLWGISKKFNNITLEEIKKINNLSGNKIKPGQKLKLG